MLTVEKITYGPFAENTYILYNEEKEAWIIDPGCYEQSEKEDLAERIDSLGLILRKVINTHCHVDHITGNAFLFRKLGLKPEIPEKDLFLLEQAPLHAQVFRVSGVEASPEPSRFLLDGESMFLGDIEFQVIEVAGHTPGHIVLYCPEEKIVIAGDVLFDGSIGRTDLPGGDHDSLLKNIAERIYSLGDDIKVYCGHGTETTIGKERKTNPFVRA